MSDFYEPRSQKALFGNITLWVIGIVVLTGAIAIALWAFGVATAPWAGKGGAFKQQQSALNRVQKQEQFEQLAADYRGYLVKLKIAKQALTATTDPTDKSLRQTELIGLRQTCVDAAQQFNAESRKYTSRVWKSAGLPAQLDPERCSS